MILNRIASNMRCDHLAVTAHNPSGRDKKRLQVLRLAHFWPEQQVPLRLALSKASGYLLEISGACGDDW